MEEIHDINHLKRKSILSMFSLFFQSGYSALLGLVANLALTILLTPKIFGIYTLTLSIIALLNYFSDIGLAASLIQKKEITKDDVKTTFTVQQILIITLIIIGFIISPLVKSFYGLPESGLHLFWALLISFFISSLKTIPSIFIERKIQYQKIAFVQIVENTVFYVCVTILALMKFEVSSFTYAVLLRAIVGLVLIYSISFWIPQIGVSIKSLKTLLSFGIPFQASSFLALFKDDLIILFLGKVVGLEGVGYIGWAKKWAETPMRIIIDNTSKILFTVLSRIQDNKEKISHWVERMFFYQTLLLAPLMLGMALTMQQFVHLIPKYIKWEPALPLFYIFCLSSFITSYSTPLMNLFNALGKVKVTFLFMLFWTVLIWIFTPTFTGLFGYIGFPIAHLCLALTFFLVIEKARRLLKFNFISAISPGIISSLLMGCLILLLLSVLPKSFFTIFVITVSGLLSYIFILFILFKINLIIELKKLFIHN